MRDDQLAGDTMRGLLPLDAARGASAPEAPRQTAFSILLAGALCLSFAAGSRAQPATLPVAPTVTAGDAALAVEWQVPPDGGPAIIGYNLRYSKDGTNWTNVSNLLDPYATLTGLDNGQQYQVQVRAVNADGDGPWSASGTGTPAAVTPPRIQVETVVSDLFVPWDLAFTPDGAMLFTERNFTLSVRLADGTVRTLQRPRDFTDKLNAFEIGLMAIVVDPDFAGNRRFYTCQSHWDTHQATAEIQVISWTVNAGYTKATRVKDPLVGGIPIRERGPARRLPAALRPRELPVDRHRRRGDADGPPGPEFPRRQGAARGQDNRGRGAGQPLRVRGREDPYLHLRPPQPAGTGASPGHRPDVVGGARTPQTRRGQPAGQGR